MWKCPPATILVPVDFGAASGRASEIAAGMHERFNADVRLLHAEVLEAPAYFTHDQIASLEHQRHAARSQAETFLATFGRRHGLAHAAALLREGPAVATILAAAAESDLVVMGTHGRHGAGRWWLGSVAERVVHESRSPVMVVRDVPIVSAAAVFARPLVVAPGQVDPAGARRVAEGLAGAFGGQVAEELATCERDLARHHAASLIVVARHGRDDATERWLRACTLPMLFVPGP